MKNVIPSLILPVILALCGGSFRASAQDRVWTLSECLDYAMQNNIQLRQSRNNYLSGLEDTYQARAALFPSLSASASQNVSATPFSSGNSATYNGSYGVNSEMTLYSGGRLRTAIKQQEVQNQIDSLSTLGSAMDVRISIVQAYMQALYAQESVRVSESTVEASRAQKDRAEQMWKAGSISKVDFAQLESQLYSDEYQVTVAKTNLENYLLQLKQLLELDITEGIILSSIDAEEEDILRLIPSKETVYGNALANMPEVASSELAVTAAELSDKQARSAYLPTVGLSAGVGTSNRSGTGNSFISQIGDNISANMGLTVSIPIFSNRRNKTAVNKARIALDNSKLSALSTQKAVLKEVETAYLDALSAQAQYTAATQKEKYAQQSFELTDEQFSLGMKNTVELITAKNELLSARLSRLQSKYMALLNLHILDVYQGFE